MPPKVKMPRSKATKILIWSIFTIPLCLITLWYILPFRIFWSFDHIEQHAKKRITGTELQQWAGQVLARQPASPEGYNLVRLSELTVPLPSPLLSLYHNPPDIFVYDATNYPPGYIRLIWGGGMIGHCGFEIGPTNFVSSRSKHKWQDGVYFWADP